MNYKKFLGFSLISAAILCAALNAEAIETKAKNAI